MKQLRLPPLRPFGVQVTNNQHVAATQPTFDAKARAGCADHLGEQFMINHGDVCVGQSPVLPHTGKLEENPSQPFLAVIEKLIAKIFSEIDVARQ